MVSLSRADAHRLLTTAGFEIVRRNPHVVYEHASGAVALLPIHKKDISPNVLSSVLSSVEG